MCFDLATITVCNHSQQHEAQITNGECLTVNDRNGRNVEDGRSIGVKRLSQVANTITVSVTASAVI